MIYIQIFLTNLFLSENLTNSFILVLLSSTLLDFKNIYDKIAEKIPDDDDKELLQELIDILEKNENEKISENLDERLERFTQGI